MCSPPARVGRLTSISCRGGYLYILFRLLLNGIVINIFSPQYIIYSMTGLYQFGFMCIYLTFCIIIQYYFFYFIDQMVPALATGCPLRLISVSLLHGPSFHFLSTSLLSSSTRYPCHSLGLNHFSRESWLPFLENCMWATRAGCPSCRVTAGCCRCRARPAHRTLDANSHFHVLYTG